MGLLIGFLLQLLFTVGLIMGLGLLIAVCRRSFIKMVGKNGVKFLMVTGLVGTPIHELSHALFCLIFGHKIKEIKLYQISDDYVLGYVSHSYNKKNFYQVIGNFFIAVAPLICGSGILILLMFIMLPNVFSDVAFSVTQMSVTASDLLDITTYGMFFELFLSIIGDIFSFSNLSNVWWWIYIVLALMISSHMELSTADIKGGVVGGLFVIALLLVVDVIVYLASRTAFDKMTGGIISVSAMVSGFLAIAVIFSLILMLSALLISGAKDMAPKKK